MINLKSGVWVAPDQIAQVRVNDNSDMINVVLKDGDMVSIGHDYGKGIYETADRIIALIEKEST